MTGKPGGLTVKQYEACHRLLVPKIYGGLEELARIACIFEYHNHFCDTKTCDIFSYQTVYKGVDNIEIELLIQQKVEHDVIKDLGGFGRYGVADTGDFPVVAIDSFGDFSGAFFTDEKIIGA